MQHKVLSALHVSLLQELATKSIKLVQLNIIMLIIKIKLT